MDDNGNAIAVWTENKGTTWDIYGKRYDKVDGWESVEPISTGSKTDSSYAKIAITPDGTSAMVVWDQDVSGAKHVWARRWDLDDGYQ